MLAESPTFFARYRYWILAALALAIGAWIVVRAQRPQPVTVAEVRSGPAERVLAITGRTRPQVTVTIVSEVPGQIVRLTKEEGDSVAAGELLVRLDAAASRAAVEQVDSALAAQRRSLAEAERNLARLTELKSRGLATIKEFDQANFELDQARVEAQRLGATRREAAARLAEATIAAPVAGVVLARPVDAGQVVSSQTVIYEIAPLAGVEVETDVDERYLGEIRAGTEADVLIAGRADPLRATVNYIAPKVDPRTGGAKVRLRLADGPNDLRAGLTADVNLIVERRSMALTVSRSAILGRDASARALVVRDGRVVEQPIKFLEWPSERVIVSDGLSPGDVLLTQPRVDLIGKRVRAVSGLAAAEPQRPARL